MITPRPRTTASALICFVAVSLLPACRQPTMWTPKAPYGTTTGAKDFDLTSKDMDRNGSPMDPRWEPQDRKPQNLPPITCQKGNTQPYQAGCTDQTKTLVQDTGRSLNGFLCSLFGDSSSINGHVDWTVASARGPIDWLNFADDFDYNLLLLPEQLSGLTRDNNERPDNGGLYMEVEFDSREFDFETSWWKEFAQLAEDGAKSDNYAKLEEHMHPGQALGYGVIYGIFGIDCEHGCRSEIHPAYAVALQVRDAKDGNQWAIFARNWGDEGFCSHLNHELDLRSAQNAIHILLPYASTAGPKINTSDYEVATWSQAPTSCPTYRFVEQQGEEITIPLPPPGQQGLTEIFVDFQWPDNASAWKYQEAMTTDMKKMLEDRTRSAEKPHQREGVEEHLEMLRRQFNQNQEKRLSAVAFRERVVKPFVANVSPQKQLEALGTQRESTATVCKIPANGTPPPVVEGAVAAKAPAKPARLQTSKKKDWGDRAWVKDLCDSYKRYTGSLPDDERAKLDRVCKRKELKP